MIRRPPRSTRVRSSAASDVYKRQIKDFGIEEALRPASVGTGLTPVVKFFRYSEYLPKKTDGIFIAKQLNYYLDLDSEVAIDKGKLAYLFGLILEEKADFTTAEALGSY